MLVIVVLQWSFGVTCWEIFTLGLPPYPSVQSYGMVNYLKSGKILDKPFLSSDKMYMITDTYVATMRGLLNYIACSYYIRIITFISFMYIHCRYEIMKSCWKFVPEDRPTFSLLVEQLNQHPIKSQFIEPDE